MTGRDVVGERGGVGPLIARPVEDAAVAAFVGGLGNAGALVLEGEPGIGKSTLWGAGVAVALSRPGTVLSARAAQVEASMSFAGLGDLFEPVADRLVGLGPLQQAALDVALLRRTPGSVPPSEREIGVAVLAALRLLAAEAPVVVAIDDVQWLDRASAEVLSYALRRVRGEQVRVLLTRWTDVDDGATDMSPSAAVMLDAVATLTLQVVRVGPLPDADVTALVRGRLGAAASPAVERRLVGAARGNPYWAQELAAATAATPNSATEIAVPPTLGILLTARLARLPADARTALVVVAAMSRPSWAAVRRALSDLVSDPDAALDDAVAAGVITETSGRLRPTHPLLGSAALRALAPSRRRVLHGRLAEMTAEPEQRARHLALATTGEPDVAVAASLDLGVCSARSRGASHAAAELADLAVRLTPSSCAVDLARRRLDAAELYFAAGDLSQACAFGDDVLADGPAADVWPRLLPLLVEVTYWVRGQAAAQALLHSVLAAPDADPRRRAVALACAADVGDGTGRARALLAQESIDLFDTLGDTDPGVLSTALVYLAEDHLDHGHGVSLDLLARAEAAEERQQIAQPRWIPVLNRVRSVRAYQLKIVDDLDGARTELLRALSTARSEGDDSSLPAVLGHLALTECWAGNFRDGLAAAQEGLAHAAQTGGVAPAVLYAARGLLAVLTGDPDTARTLVGGQLHSTSGAIASKRTLVYQHVLGLAALLDGQPAAALEHLEEAWSIAAALGIEEPGRRQRLEGDLGEVLVACGQLDRAAALAASQCEMGERSRRPTLTGVGWRIHGLVLAARGELDAAVAALNAAVAAHQLSPLPLELPRSQLALGQLHRRRRAVALARTNLDAAAHQFAAIGATPWVAITQAQLTRIGATRPAGQLTPTETRVAALAGRGHNNREIGAELYVSVRTVEGHLAAIYRKLNLRGRADLARHPTIGE